MSHPASIQPCGGQFWRGNGAGNGEENVVPLPMPVAAPSPLFLLYLLGKEPQDFSLQVCQPGTFCHGQTLFKESTKADLLLRMEITIGRKGGGQQTWSLAAPSAPAPPQLERAHSQRPGPDNKQSHSSYSGGSDPG